MIYGNDIHTEGTETGWFVSEINLQGVTWSSNNTSVATVDSNGLVTTVGNGQVTIAANYNGETADFVIKVGDVAPKEQAKDTTTNNTKKPEETIGETTKPEETITEEPVETIGAKEETKTEDKACKLGVYEIAIICVGIVLLVALVIILICNKKKIKK